MKEARKVTRDYVGILQEYTLVFDNDVGKNVLKHIEEAMVCNDQGLEVLFNPINSHITSYNCGVRAVIAGIKNNIKLLEDGNFKVVEDNEIDRISIYKEPDTILFNTHEDITKGIQ